MPKTKVGLSATEISQKWNKRLKAAVPDIQRGIDGVTESPMEKAIEKQDKMLANYQESVSSGKWAAQSRKVQLGAWKNTTKEKVAQRLAGGADAAMGKRQEFDQYLKNTLDQVLPEIAGMADMTLEDQVNKVRRLMEHMHNNPYKGA